MLTKPTTKLISRARAHSALLGVAIMLSWVCAPGIGSASHTSGVEVRSFRVIVHPSNPTGSVSRDFVAQAFFKRTTRWPNGDVIHPIDLRPDSGIRRAFSNEVLQRSVTAVRSYWQQRIFSGRDLPPAELDSEDAVVKYVAGAPGAIGYISGTTQFAGTKELVVQP